MSFLSPVAVIAIDAVGISLALLDFTGSTRKLEAALRRHRDWYREFRQYAHDERDGLKDIRKQLNWKTHLLQISGLIAAFGAGAILINLSGGTVDWSRYADLTSNWPSWIWWLIPLALPAIWLAFYLGNTFFALSIGAFLSSILWRLFWILSKPKSGIVGSIGLALTLLGATANMLGLVQAN